MIEVERYLRLQFRPGGRERPYIDCWGLYRLIVGEVTGIWLGEFDGAVAPLTIARTAKREASEGGWLPVAPGDERPLDAVLMTGLFSAPRSIHAAPIHVGCVVAPGRMIDIEETAGVRVRDFRTGPIANRVRGIFRPEALA